MNLIELHMLQSFPFTCLNRDDVGAPKSAYFGGVSRARVSSQCWKRAVRQYAFDLAPEYFAGKRGHYHAESLAKKMIELGFDEENAEQTAVETLTTLVEKEKKEKKGKKEKKEGKKEGKTTVSLYLSPAEIDSLAQAVVNSSTKDKVAKKVISGAIKKVNRRDSVDVSIFGRMVADDHTLTLEGAGMFSHALSTHAVSNETDFFSAVDDTKVADDAGAGHIGVLEANSACYYRYVGLNVDLFNDGDHLANVDFADRKAALDVFLRAVLLAVPGARKNSMFGYTLPQYVRAFVRKGQPLSLVNAFEKPVVSERGGGYLVPSQKALEEHWNKLNGIYKLEDNMKGDFSLNESSPIDNWIDSVVNAAMSEEG